MEWPLTVSHQNAQYEPPAAGLYSLSARRLLFLPAALFQHGKYKFI
jgi:hypothetical protein